MTLAEFLAEVVRQLEDASIDYMIGGSVASSIYGDPRTTRDVDIVVDVTQASLRSLFGAVDRSVVYIDEPPVGQPITAGQMFKLVDLRGGWKVDLIVRKARPFSEVEFARRRKLVVLGVSATIASAEDVLLTKLEWAVRSGSSRQVDDARGIASVQGSSLDLDYLRRWAPELGVEDLLEQVLAERA